MCIFLSNFCVVIVVFSLLLLFLDVFYTFVMKTKSPELLACWIMQSRFQAHSYVHKHKHTCTTAQQQQIPSLNVERVFYLLLFYIYEFDDAKMDEKPIKISACSNFSANLIIIRERDFFPFYLCCSHRTLLCSVHVCIFHLHHLLKYICLFLRSSNFVWNCSYCAWKKRVFGSILRNRFALRPLCKKRKQLNSTMQRLFSPLA